MADLATMSDLPPCLILRICRLLDLRTLMRLRRTSQNLCMEVSNALKDRLNNLVGRFVAAPKALLDLLTRENGYVGGDVAMAFLLHDVQQRPFVPAALELFLPASRTSWIKFTDHLTRIQAAVEQPPPAFHTTTTRPESRIRVGRGTRDAVRYKTPTGTLLVYRSVTTDALVQISQQWGSHRIAYANLAHAGAGYPMLLFRYRALLGTTPSERRRGTPAESEALQLVQRDERRGFDIRVSPRQWSDTAGHGCGAIHYLCPAQARGFLDRGSLQFRLEPLSTDPLRTRASWRLVGRPCIGGCLGLGEMAWLDQDQTILGS